MQLPLAFLTDLWNLLAGPASVVLVVLLYLAFSRVLPGGS
jgi:hypothetical protein